MSMVTTGTAQRLVKIKCNYEAFRKGPVGTLPYRYLSCFSGYSF
ncbi:hypothetical protein CLOSTHATH_03676 [Hungatella hathewayi DSM 13479]|uniref:Uncharacterized protein n=1 Tax=Hungatella hathewayi DSM 13479 TaxID=566550 RepID=D3AJ86_9FIRM|nr:hypothetical protein CLOSTHATH_03676 [Hungatella hathewayi DSM 13479]